MAPHIYHKMAIKVKTLTLTIFGTSNINLEFETVASEFAKPTREDFLDGIVEFDYAQSPFNRVFSMLRQMMQLEENAGDQPCGHYFQMSNRTVDFLIHTLLGQVHLKTWL